MVTADEPEAPAGAPRYFLVNGWICVEVDHCTCAGVDMCGHACHESGCGYEPLATVEGALAAAAAGADQGERARESDDLRLLREENEQLRDALGMARTEYDGKPISELDEYDRLRLAANGFQAMDGVHRATIDRLRADLAQARDRIAALEAVAGAAQVVVDNVQWPTDTVTYRRLAALDDALIAVRALGPEVEGG